MNQARRYKVLISAYACEPDKGSEPEVGWQWVMHLSEHCDVTVLTRSNNRKGIEEKLAGRLGKSPQFIYTDLSAAAKIAKKWMKPQCIAVAWYYSAWQKKAYWKIKEVQKKNHYDLVHHLTFASFRLPFAVTGHNTPSIVGPVGGCEEFPEELLPDRGWQIKTKEIFRNLMTRLCAGLGLGMSKYYYADQVIASTLEMQQIFSDHGIKSLVMPQIGVSGNQLAVVAKKKVAAGEIKLLFVGGILYWKGLELAVHALSLLPHTASLTIIGSGPDESLLRKEIKRLKLTERIHFLGRKPHAEVLGLYKNYDLFLYPSLHDSGSFTVLEAMAAGLPIVCLDRGGPALSVDDKCGKVVKSQSRDETLDSLSSAVRSYIDKPDEIAIHGENARRRLLGLYDWGKKAEVMFGIYDDVIRRK